MQTKKHLSKPQIAGWIIWWVVTILIGLALGTLLWQGADSAAVQIGTTVFGGLYIIQQIIMIFCLKLLHKNNNYVWPVVTIVIGSSAVSSTSFPAFGHCSLITAPAIISKTRLPIEKERLREFFRSAALFNFSKINKSVKSFNVILQSYI